MVGVLRDLRRPTAHHYLRRSWISYGLNLALAKKGVIVNEKVFKNLTISELQQRGAIATTNKDSLTGTPIYIRGNLVKKSNISKAQFGRFFKQVTTHISSVPDIYVHDGAIGSSPQTDVKVRVISDSPNGICTFHRILWETSMRAVSHDPCPLTVYVASSISVCISVRDSTQPKWTHLYLISSNAVDAVGLGIDLNNGLIAVDTDQSFMVVSGKALCDANGITKALATLAEPIITSRGGLLLHPRILVFCNTIFLMFVSKDTVKSCSNQLVTNHGGTIISPHGVSTLFRTANHKSLLPSNFQVAVVFESADSSGVIPAISKLSPGQAAYHFLAGYKNGTFNPAYNTSSYLYDPLQIAKSLFAKLVDNQIPSFLVNVNDGVNQISGMDFVKLVQSTQQKNIAPFECKGGDLQHKYKNFLASKFENLPQEFYF
ncbi:uncharacterized protein [Rutidosis leptorrhynchoides]|uniref:uncharacterized protein isoform X2 n=1 Tax=Rutidosis leptorrhynchoides TaxID=125765 RepID=UPI003A9A4A57